MCCLVLVMAYFYYLKDVYCYEILKRILHISKLGCKLKIGFVFVSSKFLEQEPEKHFQLTCLSQTCKVTDRKPWFIFVSCVIMGCCSPDLILIRLCLCSSGRKDVPGLSLMLLVTNSLLSGHEIINGCTDSWFLLRLPCQNCKTWQPAGTKYLSVNRDYLYLCFKTKQKVDY